jgi:hypothetical protein
VMTYANLFYVLAFAFALVLLLVPFVQKSGVLAGQVPARPQENAAH